MGHAYQDNSRNFLLCYLPGENFLRDAQMLTETWPLSYTGGAPTLQQQIAAAYSGRPRTIAWLHQSYLK